MAENSTAVKSDVKSNTNGTASTDEGAQVMAKLSKSAHKALKMNALADDVNLGDLAARILTEWADVHPVSIVKG